MSHDERWGSGGQPTNLVRDYGAQFTDERLPLWQYALLHFWSAVLSVALVAMIIQLVIHHPRLGIRWWITHGVSYAISATTIVISASAVRTRRRRYES